MFIPSQQLGRKLFLPVDDLPNQPDQDVVSMCGQSKPISCMIMKRCPSFSTSAPSLIERPLMALMTTRRRASNGCPVAPLPVVWRLLCVSRILFTFSQRPTAGQRQGAQRAKAEMLHRRQRSDPTLVELLQQSG